MLLPKLLECADWVLAPGTARIIGLHGLPGVGKTTIAMAVAEALKAQGNRVIIVRVGETPTIHALLRDVWDEHFRDESPPLELDATLYDAAKALRAMAEKLARSPHEGQNILLLDDVWSEAHLQALDFARGSRGRVLVTTRIQSIFQHTRDGDKNVQAVPVLDDPDARDLLCHHAFSGATPTSEAWSAAIDKVLHRCGGLPLALKVSVRRAHLMHALSRCQACHSARHTCKP